MSLRALLGSPRRHRGIYGIDNTAKVIPAHRVQHSSLGLPIALMAECCGCMHWTTRPGDCR